MTRKIKPYPFTKKNLADLDKAMERVKDSIENKDSSHAKEKSILDGRASKAQKETMARQGDGVRAYAITGSMAARWESVRRHAGQIMNKENSEILLARSLRLSTIQQLYDDKLLTEEDAKELLAGPLEPGDDSTIVNDSGQLIVNRGSFLLRTISLLRSEA